MADTISAHICLGGRIPRALVPDLCQIIRNLGVGLDWDQGLFQPLAEADLQTACTESGTAIPLRLCDHDASWGEFAELQEFLVKQQLPFDRYHDSKYEFSSELLCFRPDMGSFRFLTDADERIVVPAEHLAPAVELLNRAQRHLHRGEVPVAQALVRECLTILKEQLPASLPDVPPLEIVAD